MSYTLVIVDMQPQFEAARSRRCVNNVLDEIRRANENDAAVIALEYQSFGDTNKRIAQAVRMSKRGYFAWKNFDDGSREVFQMCNIYQLSRIFRVVGVNYGCCVRDTALGLREFGYTVTVVKRACNQPKHWSKSQEYMEDGFSVKSVTKNLRQSGVCIA